MMRILRNSFLKNIFTGILLSMLMFKFFSVAVSTFSSGAEDSVYEKSTDENKDKEEESVEKGKKKLIIYESSTVDQQYVLSTKSVLAHSFFHRIILDNFPSKNIPTPPPDYCG